jgi:hypothetical protein
LRSRNPQYSRDWQFNNTYLLIPETSDFSPKKKYIGTGYRFSIMSAEGMSLGARVRYPKTGTTGKILHIEEIHGETFAELDSTHLLYRIDQLTPVTGKEKTVSTIVEDAKNVIEREREFASGSGLQDALKNVDQSCEGGG